MELVEEWLLHVQRIQVMSTSCLLYGWWGA